MKIENIDIDQTIKDAREVVEKAELPSSVKAVVQVLILLVSILINRLKLNSSNSSKPPSMDPNRKKKLKDSGNKNKGGQKGHKGMRLEKVKNPDKIKVLKIDRKKIPIGKYKDIGYESRQVIDIQIKKVVTEYRAQILEDENGKKYTASFPENIKSDVQYGTSLKSNSVYMSQFQLLPYNRIQDYFTDQMGIPLSLGSIFNFNQETFDLLEKFDEITKRKIINSLVVHADETGINIGGKRKWLHLASTDLWSYYYPHKKRGSEAIDDIGIISKFSGILCHDHWKPYYNYNCTHALCNAHHLRELENVIDQYKYEWASKMKEFLIEVNKKGKLSTKEVNDYREKYRNILKDGNIECPKAKKIEGKKGRVKQTKARNLLERLIDFEDDVLRFMENELVSFTNNLAENDLRMTKVQQKISGCFRSFEGAYIFCRIRGYLSTCRKHGLSPTDALRMLFERNLPDFINDS
ncbi:MAG: IS66 family transposase [Pelagibacterales bacterium]|nr:IS66 family transposase [Pelagibacterales bacterium]